MSTETLLCPNCQSTRIVKNGKIHNGKQNHKCRDCGRQFVQDPQQRRIDEATKALIERLLLEKLSLAGIARVAQVSEGWLQEYVNGKYNRIERQVQVTPLKKGT